MHFRPNNSIVFERKVPWKSFPSRVLFSFTTELNCDCKIALYYNNTHRSRHIPFEKRTLVRRCLKRKNIGEPLHVIQANYAPARSTPSLPYLLPPTRHG